MKVKSFSLAASPSELILHNTSNTTSHEFPTGIEYSTQNGGDGRLGFYIVLFIIGTIGNTVLIVAVMKRRTQKTVYEMLVLNLGVADLLLILLHIVPNVHTMITNFQETAFYCNFIWPMNTVVFLLEIFTITSMALHRYWLIVHPYRPKPTTRATAIWIAGVWISAITITLPLMIITREVPGSGCVENWPSDGHRKAYTIALLLLEYAIPLVVIATAYARIVVALIHSRLPSTGRAARQAQRVRKENLQVIKTLAAIVLVFSVGMLPIQVAWMIKDFGPATQSTSPALEILFSAGDIALCFHASLDPFVYGFFVKQFRRDYVQCFYKALSCCFKINPPVYLDSSAVPLRVEDRSTNRVSSFRTTGESPQAFRDHSRIDTSQILTQI